MFAHIPVDIGYRRIVAESEDTDPHTITIDVDGGERFINAFALEGGSMDYVTDISMSVASSFSTASVTFTAPDSDPRTFVVIVMGGGVPTDQIRE